MSRIQTPDSRRRNGSGGPPRLPGARRGVSLLDVVLAFAVLLFGLVPILYLQSASARETSMTREDFIARFAAFDVLDWYAGEDLSKLKGQPLAEKDLAAVRPLDSIWQAGFGPDGEAVALTLQICRGLTVAPVLSAPGLYLLTVTLQYTSLTRKERTFTATRYVFQQP